MKHLIADSPYAPLHGRSLYTTQSFVTPVEVVNKTVLNIGCGFGWFEAWATGNGVESVVGLEPGLQDLRTARKLKHPKAKFLAGNAFTLPFNDDSFDLVVCWEVLEHLPRGSESLMFPEVARVLKKGGCFFISTPNASFWSCVLDPAWWLIGHRHYSARTVVAMAATANLVTVSERTKGGFLELMSMLNLYAAKWLFRRDMLLKKWFVDKLDPEYLNNGGFATLFFKFEKAE